MTQFVVAPRRIGPVGVLSAQRAISQRRKCPGITSDNSMFDNAAEGTTRKPEEKVPRYNPQQQHV